MLSHTNLTSVIWMSARCNCMICGAQTNTKSQFAEYVGRCVPKFVEGTTSIPLVTESLIFYA